MSEKPESDLQKYGFCERKQINTSLKWNYTFRRGKAIVMFQRALPLENLKSFWESLEEASRPRPGEPWPRLRATEVMTSVAFVASV